MTTVSRAMFLVLAGVVFSSAACGTKDTSGGVGGGDAGTATEPLCTTYCDSVMKNCTSDQAVYASMAICLGACATMEPGTLADTSGNTLGCRQYHAGTPAMMDPATHCPHAGPGGDGYCGDDCSGYCQLVLAACPAVYASEAECMTTCKTFSDDEKAEPFSIGDVNRNTLQCRLYHASVATTDPGVHCAHVGAMSPTCTDP